MPTDTTSEAPASPTTDPVVAVPAAQGATTAGHRTDRELAHELIELEKQFDPPERGESVSDARWYEANESVIESQYRGMHVAIMNGAVVGYGCNALQLELDLARKYNVHPQRFLIVYVMPSAFE
jgi:hypothetical protein